MSGNILQLVLVEGPPDQRAVDHNLRLLMFGRPQAASPAFASFVIASRRPPPSLFEDPFVSVYSVTEAYQQTSTGFGATLMPVSMLYTRSNRVLEEEWPYPQSNHKLLNQFRWKAIGLIRGYTFEVPDLNDYPWLEWPVQRADRGAALYPFRQIGPPPPKYQWPVLFWKSRNWDIEAERDITRHQDYALGPMLFFGKPQEIPPVLMPNLVGNTLVNAQAILTADQIVLGTVTYSFSDLQVIGVVLSQSPLPGILVPVNTVVTLGVSLGEEPGQSLPFQGKHVTYRAFSLEEMVSRAWGSEFKAPDHRVYTFGGGAIGKDSTDMGTTGFYKPPGYSGTGT